MIVLLFIPFLFRCDYLTLLISLLIFSIEFSIVSKKVFEKVLILLSISWVYDSLWLMFYLNKWHIASIQEMKTAFATFREISVFFSGAITLLKLILIFSLWRLVITEKVNEINPLKKSKTKTIYEKYINASFQKYDDRKSHNTPNLSEI